MNGKIRLKVPATSANLGAGFDAIGIALTMYCYATFRATDGGLRITGCPEEFQNEDNMAAQAFRAVEDFLGVGHRGVREVFMRHHADLLDAAFWQAHQARIRAGHVHDVFPYERQRRLHTATAPAT